MTEPQTTRIPNLLHLLLFLALTFFSLILCEGLLLSIHPHAWMKALADQRLQLFVNIATYAGRCRFGHAGLSAVLETHLRPGHLLEPPTCQTQLHPRRPQPRLSLASRLDAPAHPLRSSPSKISSAPRASSGFLPSSEPSSPPVFEEIIFRGFLLPGIAIAVDYVTMPKSLEALEAWRTAEAFSTNALVFSSIVTSLCFAAIHAPQLGFFRRGPRTPHHGLPRPLLRPHPHQVRSRLYPRSHLL